MPWLLIIQIVLLGLWYTVAPTLPAWLVFVPMFIAAFWVCVMLVIFAAAGVIAYFAVK